MSAKRTLSMLLLAAGCAWAQQTGGPPSMPPAGAQESAPASAAPAKTDTRLPQDPGKGKRDPFQSIISTKGGKSGVLCTGTGKACMAAAQAELKGVAKTQEGFIAMVASGQKTYFLRLNEPVLNGYVLKITGDSITFRENVVDNVGRTSTRDVVKRITGSGI